MRVIKHTEEVFKPITICFDKPMEVNILYAFLDPDVFPNHIFREKECEFLEALSQILFSSVDKLESRRIADKLAAYIDQRKNV